MMKSQQIKSIIAIATVLNTVSAKKIGDNCCNVYGSKNFEDFMEQVCVDRGHAVNDHFSFDRPIQSMECGKDVAFKHYDAKNGDEQCYDYGYEGVESGNENAECAKTTQFGSGYYVNKQIWNSESPEDNIESSKLDMFVIADHTQQDGVTFFEMSDCYGYSGTVHFNNYRFDREPVTLQAHRSELNNIKQISESQGFGSVYVPVGYELLLDDLSIKSTGFLNEIGMQKCHNIDAADAMWKKLTLRKISDYEAKGYWKQSKYNQDIDMEMQIEIQSVDDSSKEKAQSDISFFMRGLTYEGASLTSDFFEAEMHTALLSAVTDSKTQPVHCAASQGKAALYQWVIEMDGYTILTDHFVCRSGHYANLFPSCPDSACEDDQCDICIESWKQSSI